MVLAWKFEVFMAVKIKIMIFWDVIIVDWWIGTNISKEPVYQTTRCHIEQHINLSSGICPAI